MNNYVFFEGSDVFLGLRKKDLIPYCKYLKLYGFNDFLKRTCNQENKSHFVQKSKLPFTDFYIKLFFKVTFAECNTKQPIKNDT